MTNTQNAAIGNTIGTLTGSAAVFIILVIAAVMLGLLLIAAFFLFFTDIAAITFAMHDG